KITVFIGLLPSPLAAATPHIFVSDLESGPNIGGENNNGVYVTVYGKNFGGNRGSSTVTVGGGPVGGYPLRSDTKITFQLGGAATTGNITVQTTTGGTSNAVPFTIRPGNIFLVSVSGNDNNPGTVASPWRTIQHAVDTIAPGDTVYISDGIVETKPDAFYGSVLISSSGEQGRPKALVAYPNAHVVIGGTGTGPCSSGTCVNGLKTLYDNVSSFTDWVISGLTLKGNNEALGITGGYPTPSARWRVVGNEMTCPWGDGGTACVSSTLTQYL